MLGTIFGGLLAFRTENFIFWLFFEVLRNRKLKGLRDALGVFRT
jgi:hypothetical protein